MGAPRKKCQTPIKESTWTIEFNVRRTEHDYYRHRKSDKRSTHHLRVRRSTEYFICVIFITALVRTSSRFHPKWRNLWNPDHESIFNKKGSSSAKRNATIYKSMAQGVPAEFTWTISVHFEGKDESITVGDIVVIKNNKTNRNFWKLAMVETLLRRDDNMVRAAVVQVLGGKGDHFQRLRRPYPTEVRANERPNNISRNNDHNASNEEVLAETSRNRPRREAAVIGELKRIYADVT